MASSITKAWAKAYLEHGFSVFPVEEMSKTPTVPWKQYQAARPTKTQVGQWKWDNVGIVTGLISELVVIDQDDLDSLPPEERAVSEAFLASLPPTVTATTGKGRHFYYRPPVGLAMPSKVRFLPGLDCRGEGGYVVAPPSLHPSGAIYTWEEEVLEEDNSALDSRATLPESIGRFIATGARPVGRPPAWMQTLNKERPNWTTMLGGVKEGEGRNNAAAQVAGAMLRNAPEDLWELSWAGLKDWNSHNDPPLPEKELRTTFDSIARKEKERRTNDQTPKLEPGTTLQEFMKVAPPKVEHLIENILPPGLALLVGKPKLGKSRLATQLALSVAGGFRPFTHLDCEVWQVARKVQSGKVIYYFLEDDKSVIYERIAAVVGGRDYSSIPFRLEFSLPPMLEGGLIRLREDIERERPHLVVVDTLAGFIGAVNQERGNAFNAEYRLVNPLRMIARETGTTILVVHHARKDQGFAADPFDAAAGTLGSSAVADSVMIMTDFKKKRPVTFMGHGRKLPPFELTMRPDGLKWQLAEKREDNDN